MVHCAIFGCNSNNNKKLKSTARNTQLSFFSFPKEKPIYKKWVLRCGRKEKLNIKNARVCSLHFSAQDYSRRYDLLDSDHLPTKRTLKSNAIPSRNLPQIISVKENDLTEKEPRVEICKITKSLIPQETADVIMEEPTSSIETFNVTSERDEQAINNGDEILRLNEARTKYETNIILVFPIENVPIYTNKLCIS